jgi:hypothetical protein
MYAGVPVLPMPDAVRAHFAAAGAVVIAIDDASRRNRMIDPVLERVLVREGVELCRDRCGTLRLYFWRLH